MGKRVFTKQQVPKGARRLWAQCLVMATATVLETNSVEAWKELLALPKSVLRMQTRGGASRRRGEAETKLLCRRWLEGQRDCLWAQGKENKDPKKARDAEEVEVAALERASSLVAQEQLRKACASLIGAPPAIPTRQVIAEMERKHPPAGKPVDWAALRTVHAAAAHQPDGEKMTKAIKSFPKGSAGGASGLRPQHLKDALVAGFADELMRNVVGVVQIPTKLNAQACGEGSGSYESVWQDA